MADFVEVADRVWVARYAWFDVNVTAIGGPDGLLVVDTHGSAAAAREVVDDVRRIGAGPVTAVVNTHEHFDHTFGNQTMRESYGSIPIHAHEWAAAHTVDAGEWIKAKYADSDDPHAEEIRLTTILPADHTFSSARVLHVGERVVELVHPGRGHTAGDLVVRIPDADVVLAGDLVEESAPPAFGRDSWPLEWPASLDVVLGVLTGASLVVPGHGAPVGRRFVEDQRDDIIVVAETIRDVVSRGVAVDDAFDDAEWPFPRETLEFAIRRGYEQLPSPPRQLPLV